MKVGITGNHVFYWCPGCKTEHQIVTPRWSYNGNPEKPTFSPSILVIYDDTRTKTCHHFVRDGQIQYLNDCFHDLKDRTVPMEDFDNGHYRA